MRTTNEIRKAFMDNYSIDELNFELLLDIRSLLYSINYGKEI